MSIAKKGLSAIGKLVALGVLVAAFMLGMATVVFMSLQGKEVQVPDITGKDLSEADKELALLGLKIKKRADRVSAEKPGTVIEELPKPGETVKTGQMILVVTSRGPENGVAPPPSVKTDEDDSEKIEEMISDKPKKPKANSNTAKKKPDTSRDVNAVTDSNSSAPAGTSNSNKTEKPASNSTEKPKPSSTPDSKPKTVDSKLNKKPGVQR
ncbi:MAG TPA: PASTA domain-containing protein [Pyrinomonadaceae bacterium]|nr:PASTA domain-containing protein [Pyrinomonadaceae bacterium]